MRQRLAGIAIVVVLYLGPTRAPTRARHDLKGQDEVLAMIIAGKQPGETYDLELDCLQLTLQRLSSEEEVETVTLGDFDMAALFGQAFDQAGVSAELRTAALSKYDELRVAGC